MITYKQQFRKTALWFGLLFLLMFFFRLIYGYAVKQKTAEDGYYADFFSNITDVRKNYASEKMMLKEDSPVAAGIVSSQKFEKTALIKTKTTEYERDEKLIKAKTKAYHAIIQYEQNLGQKGSRELHLLIGVPPASFDAFYAEMKKIGKIKAAEITKVDKTNEYRQLNAQKTSSENTLKSLYELKKRDGKITDFVELNNRIMEIEEKLQDLGVDLGNFDTENEFCTVKLSVYEGAVEKEISLFRRVKIALEWTIKYFAVAVFSVACIAVVAALLLYITAKLSVIAARYKDK